MPILYYKTLTIKTRKPLYQTSVIEEAFMFSRLELNGSLPLVEEKTCIYKSTQGFQGLCHLNSEQWCGA